jgi:hypothetical protein
MDIIELLAYLTEKYNTEDIIWYSWPCTFPTTGGPSGCGGNTITSQQVYAFEILTDRELINIKYCCGIWRRWGRIFLEGW